MRRAMPYVGLLLLWISHSAAVFADPPPPEQPPAEKLFQTAMKFELEGDNNFRQLTLRAALAEDDDYAKAHWHLGEVKTGGKWRAVSELVNCTDPILSEYGERRQKSIGDPQSEFALAKWCRANKLPQREQLHLIRVVANPQTEPALRQIAAKRLKLKNVNGRLMTEEQLAAIQRREAKILEDYKNWAPKLAKFRDMLASGSDRKREEAKAALAEIRDPAAVLALECELSGSSEQAALLAVNACGNIPHHDASLSLVRLALGTPWPSVMDAASEQLKARPMHEFVPVLLAGIDTPIQTASTKLNAWGNAVAQQQIFFKEGMDTNQMFILNRLASTRQIIRPPVHYVLSERLGNHFASPTGEQQLSDQPALQAAINNNASLDAAKLQQDVDNINRDLNAQRASNALMAAAAVTAARTKQAQAEVGAENQRIAAANARVFHVLRQSTGQVLPERATDWWDWWHRYNEVSSPRTGYGDGYPHPSYEYKPTVVSSYISAQQYGYESQPVHVSRLSCFVAGTPVWTDTGVRPVEDVLIGDSVLAIDPDSGELCFAVVLEHTLRPPSEIMRIGFAEESISCTKGHPFWVNGAGWKMAKELAVGDRIHGLRGASTVASVDNLTSQDQAHNLVVAGVGTYLVGHSGLLAHDNTYRTPTRAVVPGYAADQGLAAN